MVTGTWYFVIESYLLRHKQWDQRLQVMLDHELRWTEVRMDSRGAEPPHECNRKTLGVCCSVQHCRKPIDMTKVPCDYEILLARDTDGIRVFKYKHKACKGTLV
jgi:hypothetical protein